MLESVINLSEGSDKTRLEQLAAPVAASLLDLHADAYHHRSVFTLAGRDVLGAARRLATVAVDELDLRSHHGVHPRLGVVDVVPFVPIGVDMGPAMDLEEALAAREEFAHFAARELGLPCFCYGPERSLPEIRRRAFVDLAPDFGPQRPDPRRGAVCVGARPPLIAYNLVLAADDLELAKRIARTIRASAVRSLGFRTGQEVQVSCNLVEPWAFGPADCYDAVASIAPVRRAELVGLIPRESLEGIDPARWNVLDLSVEQTLEWRLANGGRPPASS